MFAVFCPGHGRRVLLSAHDIVALRHGPEGMEVHFRCTCGREGVWRTGGRRGRDRRVAG